jgi:hypothetical protein
MTASDESHVAEWISDSFAIVCSRIGGFSDRERNIRRGFEAIMRQLGTPLIPPADASPADGFATGTSSDDLQQILQALDSSLTVFARYDRALTNAERRIQILLRATRRYTGEELHARECGCTRLKS